jgi:crotonobetainyl-CoA:carnitine CoA-transferase CaiB-like acyl-CoA transferase
LTGDYLGMLLADEGADVIKIESPQGGDYLRHMLGAVAPGWSPAHLVTNRNKRSLTLDLRQEQGRQVLYRLLEDADVFITGNVGDIPRRLGFDYETLSAHKPELIYCQATGFGAEGPLATLPTHGMMMNALVGGTPVRTGADGLAHADRTRETPTSTASNGTVLGPLFGAYGVAAALVRRSLTGRGAYIDISCADSVVAASWLGLATTLNAERIQESSVPFPDENTANYNYYRTGDGRYLLFCAQEPRFWENFCRAVGREDLLDLTKWGNGVTLRHELQRIFEAHPRDYWTEVFLTHNVPAGPVVDVEELESQPHLRRRDAIIDAPHPVAGPFKMVGDPIRVRGERFEVRHPAPAHGEHTDQVLAEFGYTPEQIRDLRERGVI